MQHHLNPKPKPSNLNPVPSKVLALRRQLMEQQLAQLCCISADGFSADQ